MKNYQGLGLAAVMALAGAGCTSSSSTCVTDSSGYTSCTDYVGAYPYALDYTDPWYGVDPYYPYAVDTYYYPGVTYDPFYYSIRSASGDFAAQQSTDSTLPELFDVVHRSAGGVNDGLKTALAPIGMLLKTTPTQTDKTLTFGPQAIGNAVYRFIMTKATDTRYGWKLQVKGATAGDDAYVLAMGGTFNKGAAAQRGTGVLGIDLDKLSSVDATITARGQLLLGFAQVNDSKVLRYHLENYTPNKDTVTPTSGSVTDLRIDSTSNDVRAVLVRNLSETATTAPETIVARLRWRNGTGGRVDAVATMGDIPADKVLVASACAPADLSMGSVSSTTQLCAKGDLTSCMPVSAGTSDAQTLTCPTGLDMAALPNPDPTVDEEIVGAPTTVMPPASVPTGDGT